MYAWEVEESAERLRELRREQWEKLSVAGFALGLAIVATELRPELAWPLFLGGLIVGVLGMRALWRHWDLVDRLAQDHDALLIPDVLEYASREATPERRRAYAASIRNLLDAPDLIRTARLAAVADELDALASELEDDDLTLDPVGAVACMRLVSDPAASPLLNAALAPEELRSKVRQIRFGFTASRVAG
jgi:hypothetical protein